uniref:Uncharacterized protein n=1 Tax=Tanacetum cinerariifolium TaxID=118510 RepID=A0A699HIV2_TANCI|nr:hypothetical protein [Tanacetum cinerariifolium]
MLDEPMVGPIANEIVEPVNEAEEQVVAPVVGMDEDNAMLFGDDDSEDDDFSDDDSEGIDEEEVEEVNEEWLMAPITPPPMLADLSTRSGNLEYRHGKLVKKVIQVSDAEVAAGVSIKEIGPRVFAIEGQVQMMASQMVHPADRWEQDDAQVEQGQQTMTQRDEEILRLVPSCFVIFDLEPLSLSFEFVFTSEIFKSLSFSLDHLFHLAIVCLDQHAHTLHHLESLLTISFDILDILKEDLVYQSLGKSLSLCLRFLDS